VITFAVGNLRDPDRELPRAMYLALGVTSVTYVLIALLATVVVLGFFAVDTLRNAPETFVAIVAIAALAVLLDAVWKHVRKEPPLAAGTSLAPPTRT